MRAKYFHGALNRERLQETSQNTHGIRYKCMLNLSMGLPIMKDVDKHRRIHIKVIKWASSHRYHGKYQKSIRNMLQNGRKTIQNSFQITPRWLLVRWVALDSAEMCHISMKSVPMDTRTVENGSQRVPKWPQNDAKMAPNGSQMAPRRVLVRSMASESSKIRENR